VQERQPMDILDQIAQKLQNDVTAVPMLLQRLLIGLLVFAVGYGVTRLVQYLVVRAVRRTPGGITVEHALSRVIAIVGITLAFLTALSTMGVDIGALIAALGLTSLAIGLALKDTIENAITGVLLLIQRPFKVGDVIKVSDVMGTVADVAIRTTNIKTLDGLHVLIPNRHVYNEVITNWSYYPTRRMTLTVGVAYETDLAQAYRVLSEAVAATPGVLAEPALAVSFEGFDESSIRMVFRFWIERQTTNPIDIQTQLTQVIMDVTRREGINIPLPIRTVLLHNPIESAPQNATTR
jgi:small conductance mechanosensitive channel